ncbi:hypothetical protein VSX61_20915 [Brenneria populi subsp. brevivirga]|uniref:Uncharacterized protein n=1 Tax=Pectobacterium betavasculorum TaxID=55207 RepID=A0A093R6Z4_9GAMM|nr:MULTISPECIES: hypothetical protein [Pectobacteriaceae]KFW98791.1 hypothetical protein KP22_21205 [Pectobacterium betavasculorum]MEC5321369.1 hypothetical protein [Brenneria populi subsp. brevivirga]
MHKFSHAQALHSVRSALFFSLITGPALSLFFVFLLLSFNNSLAGTFVKEARELVANVPVDKVRMCIHPKQSEPVAPVKPLYVSPCEPVFIDTNVWQENWDRLIRNLYLTIFLLSFSIWLLVNGLLHISVKTIIRRIKSDR